MARVKLFGILRRYAAAPLHEAQGATVRDVLESLCAENAPLHAAIFDGATLRPHVRVMINGRDVELVQGLLTPLAPDDEVAIFPPIAGGWLFHEHPCLRGGKLFAARSVTAE